MSSSLDAGTIMTLRMKGKHLHEVRADLGHEKVATSKEDTEGTP
ncbi:MAG: hypothetical protein ACON34_09475 [Flavobacteriales bacterium]